MKEYIESRNKEFDEEFEKHPYYKSFAVEQKQFIKHFQAQTIIGLLEKMRKDLYEQREKMEADQKYYNFATDYIFYLNTLLSDLNNKNEISLCNSCYSMTKTLDNKCGKCGGLKELNK